MIVTAKAEKREDKAAKWIEKNKGYTVIDRNSTEVRRVKSTL